MDESLSSAVERLKEYLQQHFGSLSDSVNMCQTAQGKLEKTLRKMISSLNSVSRHFTPGIWPLLE